MNQAINATRNATEHKKDKKRALKRMSALQKKQKNHGEG
jgi:hypothetical protein